MTSFVDVRTRLSHYLDRDALFAAIFAYTQARFDADKNLTAHNWEHAYRDTLNAIVIGEAEGADMAIVLPAMVMHDIGFLYGATGKTHGSLGAEKLDEYLADGKISTDPAKVEHIRSCIRTHKGSMHGEQPETLEAKVVSDADLLEKLGPVGVYQSIRTYGEFNYDAARVVKNLSAMDGWAFQTNSGRILADERKQFSIDFARDLAGAYQAYNSEETEPK